MNLFCDLLYFSGLLILGVELFGDGVGDAGICKGDIRRYLHISNIAFVIVVNDQFNILFVFTPEEEDR
jgi:hypothetical protein